MCDAGFGGGVLFEEVADFEVDVWEYTLSAVTARPLRGVR